MKHRGSANQWQVGTPATTEYLDRQELKWIIIKAKMKIKLETKVIELTELWFDYLFPYLVRFCISNNLGIEWKNDVILISKDMLPKFNYMLGEVLEELMVECYKEPTQKERSKNSSRYQKVEFKGVTYVLNYRTDIVGKMGYALNYLINETKSMEE